MAEDKQLLVIDKLFSQDTHPYDSVEWTKRDATIANSAGEIIFEQKDMEFPSSWSQLAVNIVSSKYFYGKLGSPEREHSLKQLIDRVVDTIADFGLAEGYFNKENRDNFEWELKYALVNQYFAFNTPIWLNCGLFHKYNINKPDTFPNYYWDNILEKVVECNNQYEKYQGSACFLYDIEDNIASIMEANSIEAKIFRNGSGAGVNNSSIRSKREFMSNGGQCTGPLEYMKIRDRVAAATKSGGVNRRSAKMCLLDVTHPDIMEFINAKTEEEAKAHILIDSGMDGSYNGEVYRNIFFQNSNFSINVTDDFMQRAKNNQFYNTKSVVGEKTVNTLNAKDVLMQIAANTHKCGDPGLQYIDMINKWNTLVSLGSIRTCNPCGELQHIDNVACNLASINILKFLNKYNELSHLIRIIIFAMDIIVSQSSYPTKKIAEFTYKTRPLGLGYTNLGGALMSLGIPYDSDKGRELAGLLTSFMSAKAGLASAELAKNMGAFHYYPDSNMLTTLKQHSEETEKIESSFYKALKNDTSLAWEECIVLGSKYGYRNSQHTLYAPCGTISFMMDADCTGVEPALGLVSYKLLAGSGDGLLRMVNGIVPVALKSLGYQDSAIDKIVRYIEENDMIEGCPELKPEHLPVFDCAFQSGAGKRFIHYMGHVKMMAACIKFVSGAISKTVNVPESTTVEEIFDIYLKGWELGLKNIAIYRNNSKKSQPLKTSKEIKIEEKKVGRIRPEKTRNATNHQFDILGHRFYLTVGLYEDGSPCEIFIRTSKSGSTISGLMDSFAVAISIGLQHGVPLSHLVDKFSYTKFDPMGITDNPEIPIAHSAIDYIFRYLGKEFLHQESKKEDKIEINTMFNKEHVDKDTSICNICGGICVRAGKCYTCTKCGSSSGCG